MVPMKTRKFVSAPPEPFEAVKITPESLGDICKWLIDNGNYGWEISYGSKFRLSGWQEVGPKDDGWLCRSQDGKFFLARHVDERYVDVTTLA